MMKNDYGITVMYWGNEQVTGTDEKEQPFYQSPEFDSRDNAYISINGQKHYAKEFRTLPLKLPIFKFFEVSTAHIQERTNIFLREAAKCLSGPGISVYAKGDYGYWINVDPGRTDIPEDLAALIELADQNNCIWLVLDSDGIIVDGLPKWDW